MRKEQHYRKMLEQNPNASVGFSLAACMVYAARYGSCDDKQRSSEEWKTIARRLKAEYGENMEPRQISAEMDSANRSAAAAMLGAAKSERKAAANRAKGSLGGYPKGVVTWQDTRGNTINICKECQKRIEASGEWPKSPVGEEYASVSHGLHKATCDICGK